jgi:long-chain acyl-CoA synthetase
MNQHITLMLRARVSKYGNRQVFKSKNNINKKYESVSWNELLDLTNKVSKSLIYLGFGHNNKIGIISGNKPKWTITDLGILGIRGVVVPFYPTASKNDIKYIVDETKMELLFIGCNEQIKKASWLLDNCKTLKKIVAFEGDIPENDDRFIEWSAFLGLSEDETLDRKLEQITSEVEFDDLATIIYTSGTTGEPKGVMLGHDNFMNAFKINDERLNIDDTDISLCFLPLSHVFERTWTLFILYCGATNVFLENPKDVIKQLPVIKPTVMCTVPRFFEKTYDGIQQESEKWSSIKKGIFNWSISVGHKYIQYSKDAKKIPAILNLKNSIADKLVLEKLRLIFGGKMKVMPCSGAAMDPKLVKFFHATGTFVNYGYGATETTATVSCYKSNIYNFDYCGSIMPEVSVKIGENQEIFVKGKTIFKGYFNKPEETAKVLSKGWYQTGDEGYVVDGEYLVMTDRIKDLIKTSGGKFISPQKLELLIGQDKYIEQIVVFGDNRKYITALIVPAFGNLKEYAKKLGLDSNDNEMIISNSNIKSFLQLRFDICQEDLAQYEKVVKFTLLPETFNIDNQTLTNTLKIRRKIIAQQYKDLIEKMY